MTWPMLLIFLAAFLALVGGIVSAWQERRDVLRTQIGESYKDSTLALIETEYSARIGGLVELQNVGVQFLDTMSKRRPTILAFSTAALLFSLGAVMSMVDTMAVTNACQGRETSGVAPEPSPEVTAPAEPSPEVTAPPEPSPEFTNPETPSSVDTATEKISPEEVATCINDVRSGKSSEESTSKESSEEPSSGD